MFDFTASVSPATDMLRALRKRVEFIREPLRDALKGPIRDEVNAEVTALLAPYPGPVVHPFIFASDRSRLWYFAAKSQGFFDSQSWDPLGGSWDRTGTLYDGWDVETNFGQNEGFVRIFNKSVDEKGDSYAKAVYGPDAVQGHIDTGWSEDIQAGIDRISLQVTSDLADAAIQAVAEFEL